MTKKSVLLLLVWMLGMSMVFAQMKEKTVEKRYESEHPYANNVQRGQAGYSWTIAPARAQEIRVFFEYVDTEKDYDYVALRSDQVKKGPRLTGKHEKVWSEWLPGSELTIELTSDGSNNGKGFVATRYQYRFEPVKERKALVKGKLWAVLVGVSEYKKKDKFASLPAAKNDAKELYSFLVDPLGGGLSKSQVRYLPDATLEEIMQGYVWLRRNVQKEDRVLFFYAGHGEVNSKEKAYLVPKDGNAFYTSPEQLPSTIVGIELQNFKRDLWSLPAGQVAMVLDCCYSGTVVENEGDKLRAGVRRRKKEKMDLGPPIEAQTPSFSKFSQPGKQRIVITSCQAEEQAIELASHGQGAFSHYLVRGIWGVADNNGDKRVDIEEAFKYLKKEVQQLAKKRDHKQTPQISIVGEASEPYYLKLEPQARPLAITITEPAALQKTDFIKVSSRELSLTGKVRFGPGVKEIYVDNKRVDWQNTGQEVVFHATVALWPGKMKPFLIKVVDAHGKEHKHDLAVRSTYQPKPEFRLLEVLPVDKNGKEKKRFASDERVYLRFRWQISEAAKATKQELQAWGKGVEKVTQSGRIKEGTFSHRVPIEVTGKGRLAVTAVLKIEEQRKEKEVYFTLEDSDDRYEENDSRNRASEIVAGKHSGLKIVSKDEDWFWLDIKETSEVRIHADFRHSRGDLDMALWQGDKKLEKASSSDDDETIKMKKLSAGRYYLQVYGYEGAANEYDLAIEIEEKPQSKDRQVVEVSKDKRFKRFANGVIKDTKTGLEWYTGPDRDTDHYEAVKFANNLDVAGGGWRLPTMEELQGIYETDKKSGNDNTIYLDPVFNIGGGLYVWSGELRDGDGNPSSDENSSFARYFFFDRGYDFRYFRRSSNYYRVFCVRSGRRG